MKTKKSKDGTQFMRVNYVSPDIKSCWISLLRMDDTYGNIAIMKRIREHK